ncbi:hypothetical protein Gotri_011602 [Gossypium trilobum]|uniref:Uncharacterized protein n=1 Tax=Gossypium trilobum TaxID=34281 RepID=A0A7J9EUE6_9ROSI|nr:hypothetical protein [Gossypium trilobum]
MDFCKKKSFFFKSNEEQTPFQNNFQLKKIGYLVIWSVGGYKKSVGDVWWLKLIGFMIIQSWRPPIVIYFLVTQLLVLVVALLDIHGNKFGLVPWWYTCWVIS